MFPVIQFVIFGWPFTLHSSGIFYSLALVTGVGVWYYLAKKKHLSAELVFDLALPAVLLGLIGARLMYVIEFPEQFQGDWAKIIAIWNGGLVFYGGFLLAALYVLVKLYRTQKQRFLDWLDTGTISIIAAQAVGRIGCFLNGDSVGKETSVPWGVVFPSLQDGVARHPTQLYELAVYVAIAIFLLFRLERGAAKGHVAVVGLTLYALARFIIEFYRYHASGELFALGLSNSQLISIIIMAGAGVLFYWRQTNPA